MVLSIPPTTASVHTSHFPTPPCSRKPTGSLGPKLTLRSRAGLAGGTATSPAPRPWPDLHSEDQPHASRQPSTQYPQGHFFPRLTLTVRRGKISQLLVWWRGGLGEVAERQSSGEERELKVRALEPWVWLSVLWAAPPLPLRPAQSLRKMMGSGHLGDVRTLFIELVPRGCLEGQGWGWGEKIPHFTHLIWKFHLGKQKICKSLD